MEQKSYMHKKTTAEYLKKTLGPCDLNISLQKRLGTKQFYRYSKNMKLLQFH